MKWDYYNIPYAGSSSPYRQKFWHPLIGNDLYYCSNRHLYLPLYHVWFSGLGLEGGHYSAQIIESTDSGKTWSVVGARDFTFPRYLYLDTHFPTDRGGMSAMCNEEKIHLGMVCVVEDYWTLKYIQYNTKTNSWLNGEVVLRPQFGFEGVVQEEIYFATMRAFTKENGHTRLLLLYQITIPKGIEFLYGYFRERNSEDTVLVFNEVDVSPGGILTLIEHKEVVYIDHSEDAVSPLYCGMCFYRPNNVNGTPSYENPEIYLIYEEDMAGTWNSYEYFVNLTPAGVGHYLFKRVGGVWGSKQTLDFHYEEESEYYVPYETFNAIQNDNWFLLVSMISPRDYSSYGHCVSLAYNSEKDTVYNIEDVWIDPTYGSDLWNPCLTASSTGIVHLFYADYSKPLAVMGHKTISLPDLLGSKINKWAAEKDIVIEWKHEPNPEDWWIDPYTTTDKIQSKFRLVVCGPRIPEIDPSGWGSLFYLEYGGGSAAIGPFTTSSFKTHDKYGG